jgi:hypothetical protein
MPVVRVSVWDMDMARSRQKSVRKLVTLSSELAQRVERFREAIGASSESDALKMLIEDGLKLRDTREDLYRRLEIATGSGQRISDIVDFAMDHPLVSSVSLVENNLIINLMIEAEESAERFVYHRDKGTWEWERNTDYRDRWEARPKQ